MMKISIVTISYNQNKFLNKCIDSILGQKDENLEYIVVDAGSTDGSRETINKYSDIIKIFESDNGPSDGLNKGFNIATGDIYGFINADDFLLPGSLNKIREIFKTENTQIISGFGLCNEYGIDKVIKPNRMTLNGLLYRDALIFQQSTFFMSSLFTQSKGFNVINRTCWDYELYVDMLAKGAEHKVINEMLGGFRIHSESITGSGGNSEAYRNDLDRIFLKYKKRNYGMMDIIITKLRVVLRKIAECGK